MPQTRETQNPTLVSLNRMSKRSQPAVATGTEYGPYNLLSAKTGSQEHCHKFDKLSLEQLEQDQLFDVLILQEQLEQDQLFDVLILLEQLEQDQLFDVLILLEQLEQDQYLTY